MKVFVSAKAERDLEAIADYIAADDPERAIRFVVELRAKCIDLADMPSRFPLVARYEAQGIRRRLHGNYLIFYRADEHRVVVLHVVHGARDYAAVLLDD